MTGEGKAMVCLVPNCAFLSETSRALSIYKALVARGARACVVTHGGPYTRVLDDEGVPYTVLGPGWSRERAEAFLAAIPGIGGPKARLYERDELRALVDEEARFFRENEVACAVTGFALTTLLSTRVAGIQLVTDHAGSFVPPVCERKLLPLPMRSTLPFSRFLPRSVALWLTNTGPSRMKLWCEQFNELARELGVEEVPSFAALLLGDLTLVTDCPEVLGISAEDMEAWRPHPRRFRPSTRLKYVGPLFAELAMPVPERVERFLSAAATDDRPTAYVAMTSTPASLMRGVVAAVRAAGARVVVASTVHDLTDLESDDVLVDRVLPSHHIMPRVDVAVIAGGQGSVQTAMASGTPFVGIPLQPEQDFNIVEMERHGAARRISQAEAVTPRMTAVVREILGGDHFTKAAESIRAIYARADGASACADAILELCSGISRQPPATSDQSSSRNFSTAVA